MNNPRKPKIGDLVLVNTDTFPSLVLNITEAGEWLILSVLTHDSTFQTALVAAKPGIPIKQYSWDWFENDE